MAVPSAERLQEAVSTAPLTAEFLEAARYGDLEDVAALLGQGVLVDSQDGQGRSALHMAAANGHLNVVQFLIGHGANVNVKNLDDNSPLHYAALNCHIPVVEELIARGANAAALNRYDRTPLDEAIGRNNQAVADAIDAAVVANSLDDSSINLVDIDDPLST